jgi:Sec-independent protein translocase protein TatA
LPELGSSFGRTLKNFKDALSGEKVESNHDDCRAAYCCYSRYHIQ